MRKIIYTVGIDSITPASVQYGGIQGEHNATDIQFIIGDDISAVLANANESAEVYYHIDAEDSAGSHFIGEAVEYIPTEPILYSLPQHVTAAGECAALRIIFAQVNAGETEKILFSYPIKLRFDSSFHGDEAESEAASEISAIIDQAKGFAGEAKSAKSDAWQAVGEAQLAASDAHLANDLAQSAKSDAWQAVSEAQSVVDSKLDKSDVVSKTTLDGVMLYDKVPNVAAVHDHLVGFGVTGVEAQSMTAAQKAQARTNIGAFAESDAVSAMVANGQLQTSKVPNALAVNDFIIQNGVSSSYSQTLTDAKKAQARKNIEAAKAESDADWATIIDAELTEEAVVTLTELNKYKYIHIIMKTPDSMTKNYIRGGYDFTGSGNYNIPYVLTTGMADAKSVVHFAYERHGNTKSDWADFTSWGSANGTVGTAVAKQSCNFEYIQNNSGAYFKTLYGMRIWLGSESPATPLPAGTKIYARGLKA